MAFSLWEKVARSAPGEGVHSIGMSGLLLGIGQRDVLSG